MTDDRQDIETLLRDADSAASGPPVLQPGLAGRVRRLARRRRYTRFACSAGLVVAAVAVAAFLLMRTGDDARRDKLAETPDSQRDVAALQAELERLRIEIDTRMAVVERMLAYEKQQRRLTELRRQLDRPDPLEVIQEDVEQAAFVMTYQAERMDRRSGRQAEAAEIYRRVVKLFPNTRAAAEARKRLAETKKHEGDAI